jgi:nicotinate dehydrogenase subunit B
MDELAGSLGVDPLEFRLRNLADPRLRAVLETAAETFGWASGRRRNGVGRGLACGFEKGGYLANCVEVEVSGDRGEVRVRRVVAAFECGAVVNPEHLKSQIEGCIVQGIGGALFEAVEFAEGRIGNARFSRYRVPRFSDTPDIEVVLVDRRDLPSAGGSETPIVALAPAVAGALFEVTGVRLRSLPLAPQGMETTSS